MNSWLWVSLKIIHSHPIAIPLHKSLASDSVNCHVPLTDNCQGDCFSHPVPRSTSPPGTKAFTTKVKTSIEQDVTDVSG